MILFIVFAHVAVLSFVITYHHDNDASPQPDYTFTAMDEGIKQSVEWFVANYDSVRK